MSRLPLVLSCAILTVLAAGPSLADNSANSPEHIRAKSAPTARGEKPSPASVRA